MRIVKMGTFVVTTNHHQDLRHHHQHISSQIGTLVVAECQGDKVAGGTLNTITAASQLGAPVSVLLAGSNVQQAAQSLASTTGVNTVYTADDARFDHGVAETHAALAHALHTRYGVKMCMCAPYASQRTTPPSPLPPSHAFDHILAPSSTYGKNMLPRLAALLDTQPLSDVVRIIDASTFVRPIYAGNAMATVQYTGHGPCMLTVRSTGFDPASQGPGPTAPVHPMDDADVRVAVDAACGVTWVAEQRRESARPELGSADVVVSGGRALKSAENFQALERIADLLGGAVGATRAAVDAGMVPNDLQVVGGVWWRCCVLCAVCCGFCEEGTSHPIYTHSICTPPIHTPPIHTHPIHTHPIHTHPIHPPPIHTQVGQTGKVVAPKLYIALGISGAIQHLAGMKDSKTIVAINTDPDADIFKVADYGLVMDIFEALPQLEEALEKAKA